MWYATARWLSGSFYYWEPEGGYRVVNAAGYGSDSWLRPWYGYWVYSYEPSLGLVVPG